MIRKLDLTKVSLGKKSKSWVAISPASNKIVGHAKTLEQVLSIAKKARVANPTVFKIGPFFHFHPSKLAY